MILKTVFFLFIASFSYSQNHVEPFVRYMDCLPTTKTSPFDLNVFMKDRLTQKKRIPEKASSYTHGVDVDLVLNQQNEIQGFEFGDKSGIVTIYELKAGLQFGVFGKTAHTIELAPDFDPKKGGRLIMGHLTEINPLELVKSSISNLYGERDPDVKMADQFNSMDKFGLSESLRRHYENKRPGLWKQTEFKIVRTGEKWKILNSDGKEVDTIFAMLNVPSAEKPIVQGITKIGSVKAIDHNKCLFRPEREAFSEDSKGTLNMELASKSASQWIDCNRN